MMMVAYDESAPPSTGRYGAAHRSDRGDHVQLVGIRIGNNDRTRDHDSRQRRCLGREHEPASGLLRHGRHRGRPRDVHGVSGQRKSHRRARRRWRRTRRELECHGEPGPDGRLPRGRDVQPCLRLRPARDRDEGPADGMSRHPPTWPNRSPPPTRRRISTRCCEASGEAGRMSSSATRSAVPSSGTTPASTRRPSPAWSSTTALSEHLGDRLTPEQLADFEQMNSPEVQGRPPGAETFEYATLVEQMRAAGPMPDVPMVILTADTWLITPELIASGVLPDFVDQEFSDALWSAQLAAQDELAATYPDAEHITDTNATHYIHATNRSSSSTRSATSGVDPPPRTRCSEPSHRPWPTDAADICVTAQVPGDLCGDTERRRAAAQRRPCPRPNQPRRPELFARTHRTTPTDGRSLHIRRRRRLW